MLGEIKAIGDGIPPVSNMLVGTYLQPIDFERPEPVRDESFEFSSRIQDLRAVTMETLTSAPTGNVIHRLE